jgi:hypothetical protein
MSQTILAKVSTQTKGVYYVVSILVVEELKLEFDLKHVAENEEIYDTD